MCTRFIAMVWTVWIGIAVIVASNSAVMANDKLACENRLSNPGNYAVSTTADLWRPAAAQLIPLTITLNTEPLAINDVANLTMRVVSGDGFAVGTPLNCAGSIFYYSLSALSFNYNNPAQAALQQGSVTFRIGFEHDGASIVTDVTSFYRCGCPGFNATDSTCSDGCQPCASSCPIGSGLSLRACQSADINSCAACLPGFYSLNANQEDCSTCTPACQDWQSEVVACTASSDRICQDTPERAAMVALQRALTRRPATWRLVTYHCAWAGVTCDANNTHVVRISLSGAADSTLSLPTALTQLTKLTQLAIIDSNIAAFPMFLSTMPALTTLDLSGNHLTGSVPAAFLASFRQLSLRSNRLSGPISVVSGRDLTNSELTTLELSANYLGGPLPPLNALPNLTSITLGQQSGYMFSCEPTLVLAGSIVPGSPCTECPLPPAAGQRNARPLLQRATNALAPIGVEYPPPAMARTGVVGYMCQPGFLTLGLDTSFEFECVATLGKLRPAPCQGWGCQGCGCQG